MPIFDQGYQHWKGSLSGHAWRCMTISRQGIRGILKGKIPMIRILLIGAWVPALALVVVLALWGMFEQGSETVISFIQPLLPPGVAADPHAYRHAVWTIAYSTFFKFELFFIMLLVVLTGPNLVSSDLRFNALPLYFSRPLRRFDYFLGKLGVIASIVAAVAILPAVAAYLLGVCFSLDLSVIRDTWRLLPASILYGLIIVVSAGTLMLALSSLSRRSLYVGIAWVGIWIFSAAVAAVLEGIHHDALFQATMREEMAKNNSVPDDMSYDPDGIPPEHHRRDRRMPGAAWQQAHQRVEFAVAETASSNWRPLCSYTTNLQRLGDALMQTDAAWVEIGRAIEAQRAALTPFLKGGASNSESAEFNNRRLANHFVSQYPWIWSAGVLAGLWGLSIWILSMRVKSLDRLK